jgi:hypothetical protein
VYRSLALTTALHLTHREEMATESGRRRLLTDDRLPGLVGLDHRDGAVAFPSHIRVEPAGVIPLSRLAGEATREVFARTGYFRDKVVFVGLLSRGSRDMFRTVRSGPDDVPGVMLHAALVQTLCSGRGVRTAGAATRVMLVIAALVFGLVAGCARPGRRSRVPGAMAVAGAGACACACAAAQVIWLLPLPLVSLIVVAAGSAALARAPATRAPDAPATPVESARKGAPDAIAAPAKLPGTTVTAPDAAIPAGKPAGTLEELDALVRSATGGRYGELRTLSRGGMGQIFLARDGRMDRSVVVKTLSADLVLGPVEFRQRFARESRLQARVAAAGLPVILETHADGPQPFVVMEFVEGEHLQALLSRRGPMPAREALALGAELAAMLSVLHHHRVWHRDLKPLNLMIDRTGRLRLLDLGLATTEGEEALTRAGRTMGTPGYMSPEQERGEPCQAPADIYSFGAVLHELLTGRRPVPGLRSDPIDFAAHPSPEPLLAAATPAPAAELVLRCLAPAAADRPRSFRWLARILAAEGAIVERWRRTVEGDRAEFAAATPPDEAATGTGVTPAGAATGRWQRVMDRHRVPVVSRLPITRASSETSCRAPNISAESTREPPRRMMRRQRSSGPTPGASKTRCEIATFPRSGRAIVVSVGAALAGLAGRVALVALAGAALSTSGRPEAEPPPSYPAPPALACAMGSPGRSTPPLPPRPSRLSPAPSKASTAVCLACARISSRVGAFLGWAGRPSFSAFSGERAAAGRLIAASRRPPVRTHKSGRPAHGGRAVGGGG